MFRKERSEVRFFCLLFSVFCLLSSVCQAAPVYGPKMPKRSQWFIGFETNLVFKRAMNKNLGDAESNQYFYNTSYGLYDWFSFDGKLGMGDTEFDTREAGKLDFGSGLSGGYGARVRLYNNKENGTRAIFGFHHISAHPPKETVDSVKYAAIWDEWQVSLLLSKAIGMIEPYVGVKASELFIIRKDNITDEWAWNGARRHFGAIAGLAIELPHNWNLDVEGRFIDETALSVALSYKL